MESENSPRLAVVYDQGSASPSEIARGLTGVASIRFVVPRSAHVHAVLPLLEHYGSVSMLDRVLATGKLPERVDGIVTFSERMVPATARLAEQLGLDYHGVDVAAGLTDKSRQRKLLAQARVEQLRHQTAENVTELESALAAVGYPAVVKPTRSEASLNTYLIQDASQAACVLGRLRRRWPENTMEGGPAVLITEEYLTGAPTERGIADYVSVESLAVDRHRLHMAIVGTFPQASAFRETGVFWPAAINSGTAEQVAELTRACLGALSACKGVSHTEVKLTPSGPRIIEVHGRLGGDLIPLFRQAAGVDPVALAGMLALGNASVQALPEPEAVHFRYHHQAPAGAVRLLQVAGQDSVRRLPGVSYSVTKLPAALPQGTTYIDALYGSADTHRDVVELICTASRLLTFTYDLGDGGTVTVNGADLNTVGW
jgi:hypothetical protein